MAVNRPMDALRALRGAIPIEHNHMISETVFPETADIETSSDSYASRFSGKVGAWFLQVQEEATLAMLRPFPNATILDVGGGHGQVTEALIRNGYRPTVLGSAESCQTRIQPFVEQGLCQFEIGNVVDLPYENDAFDVVLSYRLLPHVERWPDLLAELARVSKQAVIVDYPEVRSMNYIAPQLFRFKKKLEGNTRTYTCFREAELLGVMNSHGFVSAERYPEFFLPMVLHRTLKAPGFSRSAEKICRFLGLTSLFGSPVILKLTKAR